MEIAARAPVGELRKAEELIVDAVQEGGAAINAVCFAELVPDGPKPLLPSRRSRAH